MCIEEIIGKLLFYLFMVDGGKGVIYVVVGIVKDFIQMIIGQGDYFIGGMIYVFRGVEID